MKTATKCLFGGALLGAGLSSSAVAGDFVWELAFVYAYASPSFGSNIGFGSFDVSATSPNVTSNAKGDASGLSMSTFTSDIVFNASAYVQQSSFHVTEDMLITIEWDFSNDTPGIGRDSGFIIDGQIFDYSQGVTGSFEFELLANTSVNLNARVVVDGLFVGASTISMTGTNIAVVPLPPAAFGGLAMLAGLGAYRRMRR